MKKSNYPGNKKIEGLYQKIINQITPFENFIELFTGTSRGLGQLGIWLAKCFELKTNFQVQNQPMSSPQTPIAPNRC